MAETNEWTAERFNLLTDLRAGGLSHRQELADRINRQTGSAFTRNSICSKIHRTWGRDNPAIDADERAAAAREQRARDSDLRRERKNAVREAAGLPPIIERRTAVHTGEINKARARVSKDDRIGAPTSSLAFKVINGIKRKKKLAENPSVDPSPFVCAEAADVIPRHLTLAQLEPGDCRYPYDGAEGFTFCGNPTLHYKLMGLDRESSYCGPHHRICCTGIPVPKRTPYLDIGKHHGGAFGRVA